MPNNSLQQDPFFPTHLNLTNAQVQEGHAVADFNDGLGADTAHSGAEATVKLEDGKLVEDRGVNVLRKGAVGHDLVLLERGDLVPVNGGILGLVCQIPVEKNEEVLHLLVEVLFRPSMGRSVDRLSPRRVSSRKTTDGLHLRVLDGVGQLGELIAHSSGSNTSKENQKRDLWVSYRAHVPKKQAMPGA